MSSDTDPDPTELARSGWCSDVPRFVTVTVNEVTGRLRAFVPDASPEQLRAWQESVPPLQSQAQRILDRSQLARKYTSILEYELPLESRRSDAIILASGAVVVFELKGRSDARQADIDQAAAYARDLRCYHACCDPDRGGHAVHAVLVAMRAKGYLGNQQGVHIVGPDALADLVARLESPPPAQPLSARAFLAADAYRPLPTIVDAARELFERGELREVHRARAFTDPAVATISRIIHDAARTSTRRLILLTGVPGAGKTLVGLRVVHARFLDDLSVHRPRGKPTAPAVYLSGNGPLVEVLQYTLRSAGGDGKVFVRGVKDYVKSYSTRRERIPPEHVLIFDEAQRAWDAHQIAAKHTNSPGRSEPEEFIEFAERIPEWSVVVGLIGGGQEIHVGEEAGLSQWATAIATSGCSSEWSVHGPPAVAHAMSSLAPGAFHADEALNLDREIRFHSAQDLHRFVSGLLEGEPCGELGRRSHALENAGFHLRVTRDLEVARDYLRTRYADDPSARFGILASSKDKALVNFGIPNDFQSTKRLRVGPWYGDAEDDPQQRSCRRLETCVTEFSAQGLELDAALVAWGTDFRWTGSSWSNDQARGYRRGAMVRDPFRLRMNSYRVLLTRGRDGTVIFVPRCTELDATHQRLVECGVRSLDAP
ncbi:MAG: DUF2075 domain-containing protein [Phycisphaeraceae bacterium]|nr:DUF2075 domain-containing protein [Phycisphaeraceae bacterium]